MTLAKETHMSAPLTQPLLHDVHEAAALLRIGRTKTLELIASGELESVSIGRRRLVPQESIRAFVARLRAGNTAA
jgi:excisionase family DNA binding protein